MTVTDLALLLLLAGAAGIGVGAVSVRWMQSRRRATPATDLPASRAASTTGDATARGASQPPQRRPRSAPPPAWAADVLVVDDSAVARAKLRRLLEQHGYTVHVANDGVQALQRLELGGYGLMISDLEMPNMDGVELIRTCLGRPQTARLPIIAVSGHDNLRAQFNACRDICGVHRKPWADDVLVSHVAAIVGTRVPRPRTANVDRDEAATA